MLSLVQACQGADFPAEIACVISDKSDAKGLESAAGYGVAAHAVPRSDYDSRAAFEAEVTKVLQDADVDLVCLAGFMRIVSAEFVETWKDRLVNIHPSLLPSFKGLDTHQRAIDAGVRFSGCTVHFVTPEMDVGPIIAQSAVPVLQNDDAGRLARRILAAEHKIYPFVVKAIAQRRVEVVGDVVKIQGSDCEENILFNPGL